VSGEWKEERGNVGEKEQRRTTKVSRNSSKMTQNVHTQKSKFSFPKIGGGMND